MCGQVSTSIHVMGVAVSGTKNRGSGPRRQRHAVHEGGNAACRACVDQWTVDVQSGPSQSYVRRQGIRRDRRGSAKIGMRGESETKE